MPHDPNEIAKELIGIPDRPNVSPLAAGYIAPGLGVRPEDQVGLGVLMAALWGRKALIAGMAMLGILAGVTASLIAKPTYRARASLQLEGFNNDQFLHEVAPISPSLPNASPDNLLQNAVRLLESETLANRIANKIGIQPNNRAPGVLATLPARLRSWIRILRPGPMSIEEQRVAMVREALQVRTSLQSQVIELFYDAADPSLAARGANTAASEFVDLNRELRWQLAQDTTDWLNQQTADLKATLEKSNQQLQEFARTTGLVFAGKQSTLAEDRMRQVQDALAKAEADRATKQARYEAARANPDVLSTDSLTRYQAELQNLRRELAQLQTLYTPTNYRVKRVEAEIAEYENSIKRERQDELSRLRTEYLASSGLEQLLSQTEALQLKTVERQMENERLYDVKKGEIETTQHLYEAMLEKVKEAGAASALRTTNVRIIDPASLPSVPYSPNPMLNMAIGLALGAVGGVGLALIRAGSDHKVRLPGQSNLPEIPELGVIPSLQFEKTSLPRDRYLTPFKSGSELSSRARDEEPSLLNDSFRAVLTSILFSESLRRSPQGNQEGGSALVVTSIDVMEGKTIVVTNLGRAAAERRRRVLLIDADLRRPRLHERLDIVNDRGLTDLLRSGDFAHLSGPRLDCLVQSTHIPNLWVLPSGPVDDRGSNLLYAHSSNLGNILGLLRREFDLVLIDTPPMMFCSDGRLLGKVSDGLVMVVRANKRSREELRSTYLRIMRDQIPVVGTILNDWKMKPSQSRTYKRYQSHYGPRPR